MFSSSRAEQSRLELLESEPLFLELIIPQTPPEWGTGYFKRCILRGVPPVCSLVQPQRRGRASAEPPQLGWSHPGDTGTPSASSWCSLQTTPHTKPTFFKAFQWLVGAQKWPGPLTLQPLTGAPGEVLCHMPDDTQDVSHGATARVLLPAKPTGSSEALLQITAEQPSHLGHALLRQSCQRQWNLRVLEERGGCCTDLEVFAGFSSCRARSLKTKLGFKQLKGNLWKGTKGSKHTHWPADTVPGFNDLGKIQLGGRTSHLGKQHPGCTGMLCLHMRHDISDKSGGELVLLGQHKEGFTQVTAAGRKGKFREEKTKQ